MNFFFSQRQKANAQINTLNREFDSNIDLKEEKKNKIANIHPKILQWNFQ